MVSLESFNPDASFNEYCRVTFCWRYIITPFNSSFFSCFFFKLNLHSLEFFNLQLCKIIYNDFLKKWFNLQMLTFFCLLLKFSTNWNIFFCIADVGGFFGNPDAELLVRWYQVLLCYIYFLSHLFILWIMSS